MTPYNWIAIIPQIALAIGLLISSKKGWGEPRLNGAVGGEQSVRWCSILVCYLLVTQEQMGVVTLRETNIAHENPHVSL